MSNVVQLRGRAVEPPAEDAHDPHVQGEALCQHCGHTWRAVAPVGTEPPFECPSCGCHKGVYKNFVQYNLPTWHCNACRCFLVSIVLAQDDTPVVACAGCGQLTNAVDLWDAE